MAVFAPIYNPTPAALHKINPALIIPTGYHGASDDPFLAELINLLITRGERTLADLAADIDPDPNAPRDTRFINLATRYLIPNHLQHMILYHFRSALPTTPTSENQNTNYILLLAVTYRDQILTLAPTIMRLLNNIRTSDNPYLTPAMINKIIAINSYLRAEAIVIDVDDLQKAANHWNGQEIRDILEHGISIQDALNLTDLGIYTAEEIITNHGLLAADYIKALLNPRG